MLARGQHGDDDIRALHRSCRAVGDGGAVGLGLIEQSLHQIEADDLVAGLDEIGGHRPAHVAESDECDCCHVSPSGQEFLFCI